MKRWFLLWIFALFVMLSSLALSENLSFQNDYAAIDRAAKSMFLVVAYGEDGKAISQGSGFVAFDEHYLITNHHVIEDAIYLEVYSDQYMDSHVITNILAADEQIDMAILEFPDGKKYESLSLDPNYQLLRGQPVTAIGSPQGILNTVSSGNVSVLFMKEDGTRDIQFTAPISHGSSGGALFNAEGNIIGLVYESNIGGNDLNYARPIQYVVDMHSASKGGLILPLEKYNFREKFIDPPTGIMVTLDKAMCPIITWNTVDYATTYKVYCVDSEGTERLLGSLSAGMVRSSEQYTDKRPLWGETVTYYVIAENDKAKSQKSEGVVFSIPSKPTPMPTEVMTPRPTLKPTPSPTAIPELPDGIKEYYEPGAYGNDVLAIKKRMQELGYFTQGAELSKSYNDTMKKRVMKFQADNGMKETGILDHNTLLMLFVGTQGIADDRKKEQKAEKEPAITLTIPQDSDASWEYVDNDMLNLKIQVKNISKTKTVEAFEIYLYTMDVWRKRLQGEYSVYVYTIDQRVRPGEQVYTDYLSIDNAGRIEYVYARINKVKYSDGTIKESMGSDNNYSKWQIE